MFYTSQEVQDFFHQSYLLRFSVLGMFLGGSEYLLNVCVWKPRVVRVDNEDGGCNQPSWKICASQIGSFSQPSRSKKKKLSPASLPKSEDQRQLEASVSHVPNKYNKWPLCCLYKLKNCQQKKQLLQKCCASKTWVWQKEIGSPILETPRKSHSCLEKCYEFLCFPAHSWYLPPGFFWWHWKISQKETFFKNVVKWNLPNKWS